MTVLASRAIEIAATLLEKSGLTTENAQTSARAIVVSDVWGIPSHGLMRLSFYLDRIAHGGINPKARMIELASGPGFARYEGEAGLGHWQLNKLALVSAELAQNTGIAIATVKNSSHCGALGVYVFPALDKNLVSIIFSNGPAAMPAIGGKYPILSTSPLAAGIPSNPVPTVVDLATSAVARGKIATAAQKGESIPEGWAFDEFGEPTTDPKVALKGMLAPLGGSKGFTISLLIENLAAGLAGGSPSSEVPDMFNSAQDALGQQISHTIITINPAAISGPEAYQAMDQIAANVTASGGRIPGAQRVNPRALPEKEIKLPDGVRKELHRAASSLGLGELIDEF